MPAGFRDWMQLQEVLALAGNYKGGMFQRLVAASYTIAPTLDPSAVPAFKELEQKISRQHDFLQSRFTFTPTHDDPYKSNKDMTQQIAAQKAMGVRRPNFKVYAEPPGPEGQLASQGHPVFTNDQNVQQRGVHDAIAHYAGKHPFSARGELAAYNRHLKTLCNRDDATSGGCEAAKAMFTEVVAQTSCYYVYGEFARQKVVILNDFDHYQVGLLAANSSLNRYFMLANKDLICRPDFDLGKFTQEHPKLAAELQRQEELGRHLAPLKPLAASGVPAVA